MSAMARFLVTGATGTIGRAVVLALRARGEEVVAVSRDPERARAVLGPDLEHHAWRNPEREPPPTAALSGTEAVIHLLGEPVAQRWTEPVKRAIRDSRVLCTQKLVEGLAEAPGGARPSVLVSQSATGYYGPCGD